MSVSQPIPVSLTFTTAEEITRREVPGYPGVEKLQLYVRAGDLPLDVLGMWIEVNPRFAGFSPQVHNGIQETVQQNPKALALKNAGLIISGRSVRLHQGTKLIVHFDDYDLHGLLDGNNTRFSLKELLDKVKKLPDEAYVEVTVYTALTREEVVAVASGQNIRKPVQKYSLMDFTGYFDAIRKSLGKSADAVIFCEGGQGQMKVVEVVSVLETLNTKRYCGTGSFNSGPQPLIYGHTGKVLDAFADDMGDNPMGPPPSVGKCLSKHASVILREFDKVRLLLAHAWNSNVTGPNQASRMFGRVQTVKGVPKKGSGKDTGKTLAKGDTPLPFSPVARKKHAGYIIPDGMILPIFSSFRANVELTTATFTWKVDIDQFINVALPKLCDYMYVSYNNQPSGKPFDLIGKTDMYYRELYNIAREVVDAIVNTPTLGKVNPSWRTIC